jgi:anaerobic selenocysteine-containing dehydrogenase
MPLTRRQFLNLLGGSAAGAVLFQACGVPEAELVVQAPLRMPEDLVTGLDNWFATLCRQCPTSEGIVVRVMEGRAKKVEGNVDYPINRGKHSARCEAGLQALYHPDRISAPRVRVGQRGADQWEEISWPDAISRVASQLRQLKDPSGMLMVTDPVGAHLGMVVERFVTNYGGRHLPYEPLDRTNLRAAMKRVFNQDVMPDLDIQNTHYLLSFGADFLNTWVSPVRYARAYGQFRQGDRERGTMVHVDSRFSMTGANADEWVYVNPGWEGVLALSIAQVIISEGLGDVNAANGLTGDGAVDLSIYAPETVAGDVGVDADRIRRIAREFAGNRPSLAIGGGSAAAHTNGLFNLVAIYSLNYLVGSVGVPGGIVFNPGPPLGDIPTAPSVASIARWRDLVSEMKQGRVRVLMVRGADPIYGLPDSVGFVDALLGKHGDEFNVPLIVSFSGRMDDTTAMADLILPEHSYLEDWGSDVPDAGPGYEMVGFQQPVVRPFFESRGVHMGTKNFPDVLLAMAQELDMDLGLPGEAFKDVLEDGARQLYEKGRGSVKATSFRSFWNGVLQRGGWWDTSARYTGPAPKPPRLPDKKETPGFDGAQETFEFYLIPFASASLTDGRGADLPWLQATPDPITTATWQTWVEINLKKAKELDIKEGDVLRLTSAQGASIEALAYPHPGISPEVVAVPVGQGHRAGGRYAKDRGSNVLSILTPLEDTDTGGLAWAATRVKIDKTGQWVRLPRFENTAPDLAVDEDQHIIQITPRDT